MPKSDIIVVGASAGGVAALKVFAEGLPPDLPAAIFVVLHIGNASNGPSALPEILAQAGPLPAKHPSDGEQIRHGWIYIAPPDLHLLVAPGQIHLSRGPKENRTRPAINPLFRSAGHTYAGRVAGVILTGMLDDGVAGLAEIKRRGGIAIAQDPETATWSSMPYNAIKHVSVDYVAPLSEIAGIVSKLAVTERTAVEREEPIERALAALTCPDCGGPIWEERQGTVLEYRCRVGHAYSALGMNDAYDDKVEQALWHSVVALETASDVADHIAPALGAGSAETAREKRRQAAAIRKILNTVRKS